MASRLQDVIARGSRGSQPLATTVAVGTLYYVTDEGVIEQSNGTIWESYSGASASASAIAQFGLPDSLDESLNWPIFAQGESRLGNPTVDDYILSSKIDGTRSWVVKPTGFSTPAYYTKIAGAWGEGNPTNLLLQMMRGANAGPSLTNISTTVARCSAFRLPFDLTVNKIRFYGIGTTTGNFHAAIYRYSDLARLAVVDDFNTAANTWGEAGSALGLALTAGVLYFIAVGVDATGSGQTIASMGVGLGATTGQIQSTPAALPGNLSMNLGYIGGYFFQFAVTGGAMPDPAATLALADAWTGGMPAFFLDNNNA